MTKKNKKDVLLVPLIIVGGKLVSFIFNALLGSYYGAGKISDAFIMAHTIPTILFDGVATALISCYIPIQRTLKHEFPDRIDKYNSNITNISVMFSVLITFIYFVFRKEINSFYAKGFDDVSMKLLNHYSEILVWSIPFIGAYSIFRAHLQVSGKKAVSSLGQMLLYFILIAALVVFFPHDEGLAWATLVGNIVCFVLFLIYAMRTGYKYCFYISFKEEYIKTMLLMIFPIFFSTLASELASIVDKYFASQYSDGIITSLTYGYQLSFAMQGVVSTSLLIVVFPNLSDKAVREDYSGMNSLIYKCIELMCWMIIPIVVGGILLAKPIVSILFKHGNFSEESASITALVFSGYLFGVLPMCVKHVGDRVCFALKKTGLAMITTFITVGANVVLDYLMSMIWGYIGLVMATGISILTGTVASLLLIRHENKNFSIPYILKGAVKPLMSSLVMGLVVFIFHRYLLTGISVLTNFVISILIGIVSYGLVSLLLFKERIRAIIEIFKK